MAVVASPRENHPEIQGSAMPPAASAKPTATFQAYAQSIGLQLRAGDKPPTTLAEWQARKQQLRAALLKTWGGFPAEAAPLDPKILGEIRRDGYRIQRLIFQTRPGVWMTANAYVPDGEGKHPAVLCVHGHWKGAKQDPVVQSRCHGLAKLGFFVLVVDAFGAGERGVGKPLGEYHGEMTGATLLPLGMPLAGLQVYENMRAVDYLQSRPEVDGKKIGITGASGGGNQTMYAGAYDERFGCVMPTCSVGTYQSYLHAACCMCEVVPGAMTFTEEAGLLSLVAPRGLMIISASRDAYQFSIGQAAISIAGAKTVFNLHNKPDNIRHATFESGHDYNKAMRESMYGWMTLHLKGEGNGSPIPEPTFQTEDPETLRCYPGDSRPDDYVTIPKFAAAEGKKILAVRKPPVHLEHWRSEQVLMSEALEEKLDRDVNGKTSRKFSIVMEKGAEGKSGGKRGTITYIDEPLLRLEAGVRSESENSVKGVILLDFAGGKVAAESELAKLFAKQGWTVITPDLRATGANAHASDKVGHAPDHNTAEWSLWIGRPLLWEWTSDMVKLAGIVRNAKEVGRFKRLAVVGVGPAGLVAICAGAASGAFDAVAAVGSLASYVTDQPYREQRIGLMAPGVLPKIGDVPHLAALVAPRRLLIAGGVTGGGEALKSKQLLANFEYTAKAYELEKGETKLAIVEQGTPAEIVKGLEV